MEGYQKESIIGKLNGILTTVATLGLRISLILWATSEFLTNLNPG